MSDITVKLVDEQEEIDNVDKIHWEKHSWKQLSLIGDETVVNLQRSKVFVSSGSVLCLGKVHQHPESNKAWKERIGWIVIDESFRDYDGINGERNEFEWNIFQGFTSLQLCGKINDLLSDLGENTRNFHRKDSLYVDVQRHFLVTRKGMKKNMWQMLKVVSTLTRKFGVGQWPFIDPDSEKKWYSEEENSSQGALDHIADKMLLEFAESGCPIFRATTPFTWCYLKKNKEHKNCPYILLLIMRQLRLFFS